MKGEMQGRWREVSENLINLDAKYYGENVKYYA
jgi:hypothetical protein